MLGAIIGDIAGSRFEFDNFYSTDFNLLGGEPWKGWQNKRCYFTDDTVMTVAVAHALLDMGTRLPADESKWKEYGEKLQDNLRARMVEWGAKYPCAGYGGGFYKWLFETDQKPYNSCGNGSAMRVSPVIFWAQSLKEAEWLAARTAEISHNHPEGIKAAVATAGAGYIARTTHKKRAVEDYMRRSYPEVMTRTYNQIKCIPHSELSQVTVPIAFEGFLRGGSFEDVLKKTIAYGNDCDTTGAIAGGIAEAYYGVPVWLQSAVMKFIPVEMRQIIRDFYRKRRVVDAIIEKAERAPDKDEV